MEQSAYLSSSSSALMFFLGLNDPRSYLAGGMEPAREGDRVRAHPTAGEAAMRLLEEEATTTALFNIAALFVVAPASSASVAVRLIWRMGSA